MHKPKLLLFAFTLATIYCSQAYGLTTDWQNSLGGSSRIILQNPGTDNPLLLKGAIEINLKDGWKTYWRNPGNNGLPPSITLNPELEKKAQVKLLYPPPELIINNNNWTNGYHKHVLLPFTINSIDKKPLPNLVKGSATIGMCKDICIPVSNNFSFASSSLSDKNWQDSFLIMSAFAALPKTQSNSLTIANTSIKNNRLLITLKHLEDKKLPQIFLDSENLTLDQPQLIQHEKENSIFAANILAKNPVKKALIHYTAINGNQTVAGEFTL